MYHGGYLSDVFTLAVRAGETVEHLVSDHIHKNQKNQLEYFKSAKSTLNGHREAGEKPL